MRGGSGERGKVAGAVGLTFLAVGLWMWLVPAARPATQATLTARAATQRAALRHDVSTLRFFRNHPHILWAGPLKTRAVAHRIVRHKHAHYAWTLLNLRRNQRELAQLRAVVVHVIGWPWSAIAQCESGGDWQYNDGFYEGGVNFAPSTWDTAKLLPAVAAFASDYAAAYDAPAWVQVAVAEAWLKRTDWHSQWPTCSRRLGL